MIFKRVEVQERLYELRSVITNGQGTGCRAGALFEKAFCEAKVDAELKEVFPGLEKLLIRTIHHQCP